MIAVKDDTCAPNDDSDCDGFVNEACECTLGSSRSCAQGGMFGACATGIQACSADGHWQPCSITPELEDTCEPNNDANCNGSKNDGCACEPSATRPCSDGGYHGPCATGTQTCGAEGAWGACDILPGTDTCVEGNDDDCDGVPNTGCRCLLGATRPCGGCNDGTQSCSDGKTDTWSACDGGSAPGTYYRDADGDTFGNPTNPAQSCSGLPTGYVSNSDDCCDDDALAHPGQTMPSSAARTGCGGHDFNCDGSAVSQNTGVAGCAPPPTNSLPPICLGWLSSAPGCGINGTYSPGCKCTQADASGCHMLCPNEAQYETRTQSCL